MALTESVIEIVENSNNPLLGKHDSWGRVQLGEIAEIQNGFAFKSAKFNQQEGVPLIRIRDVIKDDTKTFYTGEYAEEYMVQPGDLLIGMDGDFNCARWRGSPGLLNQRVCRITLKSDVLHPKLVDYALPGYLRVIHEKTSAVTVKHLSSKTISEIPLPVPPPEQQEEMVAEIEKQFSRLDEVVASLKRVKANLKRYKSSALKAAVEGKLTEEWRKQNPDVEPASKLLERILAERRTKWEEAELAKMKAKGKEPKNDEWKEKYKVPGSISGAELRGLPADWIWVQMKDVGSIQLGRQRSPKYHNGPNMRPYLRVKNVYEDRIDTSDVMEMDFPPSDFEKYRLGFGDILLNEGQSPEFLGRPAIYRNEVPDACFTNTLIRFRPDKPIQPDYPLLVFRAYMRSGRFTKEGAITTNIAHLSAARFAEIEFPVPPEREQIAIVEITSRIMSELEAQLLTVDISLKRTGALQQAVLAKLFSGS